MIDPLDDDTPPEEELEMADLEARLSIYRELRSAEKSIRNEWGKRPIYLRE